MTISFVFLSLALAAGSVTGAPHVTVANASSPAAPLQSEVHYEIQCQTHIYRLMIDILSEKIRFSADDVDRTNELEGSPLAAAMLSRVHVGRYGFACGAKGLSLTFSGFDVGGDSAPQAIYYDAVIAHDGRVLIDTGVQPTTALFIRQIWARPEKNR